MSSRRKPLPSADELSPAVSLFATLANPLRLRLLVALSRIGEMSAGDLQDAVEAEQSAVSHQLATLRRARLVTARRDGRHMMYSLLDDHVAHIVEDAIKHVAEGD
jgi:ArsR family transcriptional regulator